MHGSTLINWKNFVFKRIIKIPILRNDENMANIKWSSMALLAFCMIH
jgi:hypothetical protein